MANCSFFVSLPIFHFFYIRPSLEEFPLHIFAFANIYLDILFLAICITFFWRCMALRNSAYYLYWVKKLFHYKIYCYISNVLYNNWSFYKLLGQYFLNSTDYDCESCISFGSLYFNLRLIDKDVYFYNFKSKMIKLQVVWTV